MVQSNTLWALCSFRLKIRKRRFVEIDMVDMAGLIKGRRLFVSGKISWKNWKDMELETALVDHFTRECLVVMNLTWDHALSFFLPPLYTIKRNEKDARLQVITLFCCDLLELLLCIFIAKTLVFYIFRLRPSHLRKDNKAEGKKSNKEKIIALLFNVWYFKNINMSG